MVRANNQISGVGIGLRVPHYQHILAHKPPVEWFEIISENFLVDGGRPREILEQIMDQYQVVMHGVSLYLGSTDRPDRQFLKKLKNLVRRTRTPWLSDHLCWGSVDGTYTHDLLPMPYTYSAAKATAQKIKMVQDYLEIPLVVENLSSYVEFEASEMTEWEFLTEVTERAECQILLDVNNIYVSSINHCFNPDDYLNNIPLERVVQLHIAGHSPHGEYIIDTHDRAPSDPVWELYEKTINLAGPIPTLLEWDAHIPAFDEVFNESQKAKHKLEQLIVSNQQANCGSGMAIAR
jgi:hypothetical protein